MGRQGKREWPPCEQGTGTANGKEAGSWEEKGIKEGKEEGLEALEG